MNAKLILLAAVFCVACATPSQLLHPDADGRFRLDETTCECRDSAGRRGHNPGYVGECGLLGDDSEVDPDQRVSALWSDLSDADLSGKNLRGAVLKGATLRNTNFRGADLTCADLQWSFVKGARFGGATLRFANLRRAYVYKADFAGADLRGAYVTGMPRGLRLRPSQLAGALTDEKTRLAEVGGP
jgi:hypothetical protein